jgi:DNA-directed RNA polymerase specialized sigma24 family protein
MVQRKVARQWRKVKRFPLDRSGAADPRAAAPLETIASDEFAPSEIAVANDILERCLAQLDDLDRQLVQLKLAGHSSVESAALLGRSPAFIRMRWSRLRQTLRECGHLKE